MARMIYALSLEPGMRVLEIGTGTGYNAAVLAYLLKAENVTSIEMDPVAAARARATLQQLGYPVHVITGDGEYGYPPRMPFDRILATGSAHRLPYAWVEQVKPGGLIIAP